MTSFIFNSIAQVFWSVCPGSLSLFPWKRYLEDSQWRCSPCFSSCTCWSASQLVSPKLLMEWTLWRSGLCPVSALFLHRFWSKNDQHYMSDILTNSSPDLQFSSEEMLTNLGYQTGNWRFGVLEVISASFWFSIFHTGQHTSRNLDLLFKVNVSKELCT